MMGRIISFHWCQCFAPASREVCGVPTKSHECLCCNLTCSAVGGVGFVWEHHHPASLRFVSDPEVQWCWRIPEKRFFYQNESVSSAVSELCTQCLCWQSTLTTCGKARWINCIKWNSWSLGLTGKGVFVPSCTLLEHLALVTHCFSLCAFVPSIKRKD